jgi:hypothetical protein
VRTRRSSRARSSRLEQAVEEAVRGVRLLDRRGHVLAELLGGVHQAEPGKPLLRAVEIHLRRLLG